MQKNYDLIVAGGGTAGALCAIAAARSGVKTAVIEPLYSLGGLAANSGLTEMNAAGFQGKPLYKGIEQEILNRLLETGHGEYHFAVPMSSDPNVRVDRFRYDPEALKLVLEQLAMEAGVELFYGCTVYDAQETDAECMLQVRSGCKSFTLKSLYTVDATGDAAVVCAMGGATRVADVPHFAGGYRPPAAGNAGRRDPRGHSKGPCRGRIAGSDPGLYPHSRNR